MVKQEKVNKSILVLANIEEIRDGIEKLLKTDGYRVEAARNEEEAVIRAMRYSPNAMVVSLTGTTGETIQTSQNIRQQATLEEEKVPIVIFCVEDVPSGEEIAIGHNIYLTNLDNFNQLRAFLSHLMAES